MIRLKTLTCKAQGLIGTVVLVMIVFGIILGLYLIQSKTTFFSRANNSQLQMATFLPPSPSPTTPTTCDSIVQTKREPGILYAVSPLPPETVKSGGVINAWYIDEWPITLGKGDISIWSEGTNHVSNPLVGDESARDPSGLPYFPTLFLLDITNNATQDINILIQQPPHKPDEIFGVWKALGYMDRNNSNRPPKNDFSLPPGAEPFPQEPNIPLPGGSRHRDTSGFGALVQWKVNNLGLVVGHSYLAGIYLHDGDSVGDVGSVCFPINF